MKKLRNILASISWTSVLRVSLYVTACLIVLYSIPKEGKFKYEYQKGSPWKHETYYAPFEFSIYKSEAEIEKERQAVKNNKKVLLWLGSLPGLSKFTPSSVLKDQLQCLPLPLILAKGFSCNKQARL